MLAPDIFQVYLELLLAMKRVDFVALTPEGLVN